MKTCGEVEIYLHPFLTSILDWGKRLASRPYRLISGDCHVSPWIGGCMEQSIGLAVLEMALFPADGFRPFCNVVTGMTELSQLKERLLNEKKSENED